MFPEAIPEQDSLVLTTRREFSRFVRVPRQTETFLFVPDQLNLGVGFTRLVKSTVLGAIEDQNPAVHGKGGDDVWVLRLVSCLVDLARMVDLLRDLERDDWGLAASAVTTNLACILVVILGVGSAHLGDLDLGDLDIVGLPLGRVGSDQQTVPGLLGLW